MNNLLNKIRQSIRKNNNLSINDSRDYFADKLIYLQELDSNINLRSILISITQITYTHNRASDLKWLKYFPNCMILDVSFNELNSSSLTYLKYLPNIQILKISDNYINDLSNLRFAPSLIEVHCTTNKLKNILHIGANVKVLNCSNNHLTHIDLNDLPNLELLYCSNNRLIAISISNCISLKKLSCCKNELITLTLFNTPSLQELFCKMNKLLILDLNTCNALKMLQCDNNELIKLNIQGLTNLADVSCYRNKINILDVSKCNSLISLDCSLNQLIDIIGLSDTSKLYILLCHNNLLTSLDLSKCTMLRELQCYHNQILNIKERCRHLSLIKFVHDKCLSVVYYQGIIECYICYDTNKIQTDKIITSCRHIFHLSCIHNWFNKSAKICPYCRQSLDFF